MTNVATCVNLSSNAERGKSRLSGQELERESERARMDKCLLGRDNGGTRLSSHVKNTNRTRMQCRPLAVYTSRPPSRHQADFILNAHSQCSFSIRTISSLQNPEPLHTHTSPKRATNIDHATRSDTSEHSSRPEQSTQQPLTKILGTSSNPGIFCGTTFVRNILWRENCKIRSTQYGG